MKRTPCIIILFVLVLNAVFITGCNPFDSGSSSGSNSNTSVPSGDNSSNAQIPAGTGVYVNATDSVKILSKSGNILELNEYADISIELPVDKSREVIYSLIINNEYTGQQDVQILHETDSSIRASIYQQEFSPYSLVNMTNTRWGNLSAKAELERNLRNQSRNRLSKKHTKNSIRASADHSAEALNDEVIIKIIADTFAINYVDVNTKLRKITEHAKFFVDVNCSGLNEITDDDLEHFAREFETYIYPLFRDKYAQVNDIDNDGKLSVVFSKQYNMLEFSGLFNSDDFNGFNGNNRDLIGIWAPGFTENFQGEYWRASTRETIAHEMQHAARFSAKGLISKEDEWLDESLSVGVEARYRKKRGESGEITASGYTRNNEQDSVANDNRFGTWLESSNIAMTSWDGILNHYGQKGLFNFYLWEQFGDNFIKYLHKDAPSIGINCLVDAISNYGDGRNFEELLRDWQTAAVNEVLCFRGFIKKSQISNPKHKYSETMFPALLSAYDSYKLTKDIDLGNGSAEVNISSKAAAFFKITQPSNYSGNNSFRIRTGGKGISLRMMRLTPD